MTHVRGGEGRQSEADSAVWRKPPGLQSRPGALWARRLSTQKAETNLGPAGVPARATDATGTGLTLRPVSEAGWASGVSGQPIQRLP